MRRFEVLLTALSLSLLLAANISQAAVIVVDFDDLSTPNSGGGASDWGSVPASYSGLTWSGWEVTKADGSAGSYQAVYGNSYGAPSSANFAYNGGSGNFTVSTSSSPFYFLGADVTSFVQNNTYQSFSAQNMTLLGYLGNVLVDSYTMSVSQNSFTPTTRALAGPIDTLVVQSDGAGGDGRYWGLDNLTYSSVPEPASIIVWSMLGLSIGGAARWRRKRIA
jgi:hypothetical protein